MDTGLINNEAAPQLLTRPENCCYSSDSNNRICATMHPIPSSRESIQNFMISTIQRGFSLINQNKASFHTDQSHSFLSSSPGKENHCAMCMYPHAPSLTQSPGSLGWERVPSLYSSGPRLKDVKGGLHSDQVYPGLMLPSVLLRALVPGPGQGRG